MYEMYKIKFIKVTKLEKIKYDNLYDSKQRKESDRI